MSVNAITNVRVACVCVCDVCACVIQTLGWTLLETAQKIVILLPLFK